VQLVAPLIGSLSPSTGKNDGGYTLTISGSGFGTVPGKVTISGFPLTVTAWSDGAINVTMLNAGTALGAWNVKVITAEDANSNVLPFTFID
jgi:hypothetical protein